MNVSMERERRQLVLMLDRINKFREGSLSVGPVINDLEALLYELDHAPDEWKQAFIEEWSVLEIDYAVALDRQLPLPEPTDWNIAEALDRLVELVTDRLDSV